MYHDSKCSRLSGDLCKYTAIFGQLVICIVGNQFDQLTCAKHKKKLTSIHFTQIPFNFLHKSNMSVNFKMFKTYIEAKHCPFSCFLAVKTINFSKKIKMVDKKKLKLNWFDEFMLQPVKFVIAKSYFMYAYCTVPDGPCRLPSFNKKVSFFNKNRLIKAKNNTAELVKMYGDIVHQNIQ